MNRKYICGIFTALISTALFSVSSLAAEPEVIVTNSGMAVLMGETDVKAGSPVIIQVIPAGEGPLTQDGSINGYVNETVVQRDGKYKLLFSLDGIFGVGEEAECHIDVASKEYFCVSMTEGSLILVQTKKFDRDTKKITLTGSLLDNSVYGKELTLKIDSFEKTVKSTEQGDFIFEFTVSEAGINKNGFCDFVISFADDESDYYQSSIEIVDSDPILADIKTNSKNSIKLEEILTDPDNLSVLGFDSKILYGDCQLSELAGSRFFDKLAKTELKTDTVAELENSIKTTYALYNMEVNPSAENLKRCIEFFGLSEDDEVVVIYNSFNEDTEPEYLFGLWKKADLANITDACDFYKNAVIITKLNTAEAWSSLMQFSNSNHTLLGVDSQTSSSFWQKLVYKAPFSSLDDFKKKYDEALKSKDDKPSGGGGGGGGGTSSKSPSVSVSLTPTVQKPDSTETTATFKDLSAEHWASESVMKLYEMGIISGKGDGIFAPNDLVTRAEVAKLMCTSAKIEEADVKEGNFGDVAANHWAIGYIEAAFENELVNGRDNGNYGPEECTTREDMAVFCYRLMKLIKSEHDETEFTKEDLTFADSDEISDYATEAVAAMVKSGIINGKDNNRFDPKAYCTRAEAAKIFYGVLQ